jgi:hypothetical protein
MKQMAGDILLYSFIGAMGVLVIMNAPAFATAFNAVGNVYVKESTLLTGSGYQRAK